MSEMSQTTKLISSTKERRGAVPGQLAVPWLTVLPLALVMAYADGFWMVSLRGATGSIERTSDPFTTWLRESTLLLPVFVLAVLGALALAMRWFGPVLRRTRTVVATALMVVAAGTLVGIAAIAASSAYDYHLQSNLLQTVGSMNHSGGPAGVEVRQQASLGIQVRAVGLGSAILLATNLVLVGWVVAFRGGRLDVSKTLATDSVLRSRADDIRVLLAAGFFGSAAIHAAVVPGHLTEWAAAGVFFIVLTAVELAIGALLLAGLRPAVLLAAAVASIVPLAVWLYSRTLGIPFGPEAGIPERVGLADSAACVLEVLTLLVAVVLLRHSGWLRRPRAAAHVNALTVLAVIAVTAFGLAGSGLTWLDAFASSGDEPVTSPTAPHSH
jgi:hypothetical protein